VNLYRKAGLRIAELWFDEELNGIRVDIIRHIQRAAPIAEGRSARIYTILIDLNQEPDLLLAKMKRDTRYEIRRAMSKDNLTYQLWTEVTSELLGQFKLAHDQFAKQERLPRRTSIRLERLAQVGGLVLSQVRNKEGVPLVWHAYYKVNDRVRLLYSISLFHDDDSSQRSLFGRANRYHHWEDILAFRVQGIRVYDLGGWYGGGADKKKLSINRFKEEFGGEIVLNYNCQSGLTFAGKAAIWLYERMRPEHPS
jgi:hypothetical protein